MPWRRQSYEVLPALSMRGPELRHSLRIVTQAWMLGIVWSACVSGGQMKVFCRMLGFGDFDFGLLGAIPFIATVGQIVAAVLVEQTGLRKYQFIHCATIHRLLWLVVAAIPLVLPIPSRVAVFAALAALGVSSFTGSLSSPAWLNWMGDLIPRRIRGRYFASRLRWTQPVGMVVVIGVGVILDAATRGGLEETAAAQPVLLYTTCVIFAVGAFFGAADILLFLRIREVVRTTARLPRQPSVRIEVAIPRRWTFLAALGFPGRVAAAAVRQVLLEPLGDRVFRHYVCYGMTMTFVTSVAGWFFWLNAMDNLGFSKLATNVLFLVLSPVFGIASARLWGVLMDRWGRRPVLIFATLGTVLSVLPWFFITRHTPHPRFLQDAANWLAGTVGSWVGRGDWVWIRDDTPVGAYLGAIFGGVAGGCFWTGVNLAETGLILGFSDGHGRSKYIAASAVLIGLGGIVGGLVGGTVAEALKGLQASPVRLGPFEWNNYHATFALSMAGRFLAVFWLIGMPDPGAYPVRYMLRQMGMNVFNNVVSRLFFPLRIFGWGPRGPGGDEGQPG